MAKRLFLFFVVLSTILVLISIAYSQTETGQSEQLVFSVITCYQKSFDGKLVRGDVPQGIDLSDEVKTKQILQEGALFAQEKCTESKVRNKHTYVYLYQNSQRSPGEYKDDYVVKGAFGFGRKLMTLGYENRVLKKKLAEEAEKKRIEEAKAAEDKRRQEEKRKEDELKAQEKQDEPSKGEFLKWYKTTNAKFDTLTDEKAIEQLIAGLKDQVFLKIFTAVNYYRDMVEDIKARNPQVLWDKELTEFYVNHDRSFRKFMTSGKYDSHMEWLASVSYDRGMTGSAIVNTFRLFIITEMRYRILEKKDSITTLSGDPVKIVYIKLNYTDPKQSPTIRNTTIKETIFEFTISKTSGLVRSINHLTRGDVAWPKTPS